MRNSFQDDQVVLWAVRLHALKN